MLYFITHLTEDLSNGCTSFQRKMHPQVIKRQSEEALFMSPTLFPKEVQLALYKYIQSIKLKADQEMEQRETKSNIKTRAGGAVVQTCVPEILTSEFPESKVKKGT